MAEDLSEIARLLRRMVDEHDEPWKRAGKGPLNTKGSAANRSALALTQTFRTLHGDTQALQQSFHGLVGWATKLTELGALGEGIALAVQGVEKMATTFSKMTDIGQSFNGSMFDMMKQAGDAGLSVDEFTRTLQRNSTVAAVMTDQVTGSANAFMAVQKSVRDNLKTQGFYGMTLGELTDTTGDYLETLRETGQLDKIGTAGQSAAVKQLIEETTQLSEVTGKSREELLKNANATMRSTTAAFAMAQLGPKAQESFAKVATAFTPFPELAKAFADNVGLGSSAFTEFGKTLRGAGLTDVAGALDELSNKTKAGTATAEDSQQFLNLLNTRIDQSAHQLKMFTLSTDSATSSGALQLEAIRQSTRGIADWRVALLKAQDPVTKMTMTFNSTLEEISGNFRTKFYQGVMSAFLSPLSEAEKQRADQIETALKDDSVSTEQKRMLMAELSDIDKKRVRSGSDFDNTMAKFQKNLDELATSFGQIAADLMPSVIEMLKLLAQTATLLVTGFVDLKDGIQRVLKYLGVGDSSDTIATLLATTVAGGLVIWFKRFMSDFFGTKNIMAKQANVYAERVFGGGGGGGGGLPGIEEEPGPGPAGGPRQTLREAWSKGGLTRELTSRAGGMVRTIGSGLLSVGIGIATGAIADGLVDGLAAIDPKDIDKGTESSIKEVVDPIAGMIGMLFGNSFVKWAAPMLARGALSVLPEAVTGAAATLAAPVTAGVIAAGAGAYMATKVTTANMDDAQKAAALGYTVPSTMDDNGIATEWKNPTTGKRITAYEIQSHTGDAAPQATPPTPVVPTPPSAPHVTPPTPRAPTPTAPNAEQQTSATAAATTAVATATSANTDATNTSNDKLDGLKDVNVAQLATMQRMNDQLSKLLDKFSGYPGLLSGAQP